MVLHAILLIAMIFHIISGYVQFYKLNSLLSQSVGIALFITGSVLFLINVISYKIYLSGFTIYPIIWVLIPVIIALSGGSDEAYSTFVKNRKTVFKQNEYILTQSDKNNYSACFYYWVHKVKWGVLERKIGEFTTEDCPDMHTLFIQKTREELSLSYTLSFSEKQSVCPLLNKPQTSWKELIQLLRKKGR